MEKLDTLSEYVHLPSRGIIYDPALEIPEKISVRPFTTKDLKGLYGGYGASSYLSLIENCINEPGRKYHAKDLHAQDRLALFIRLRAISVGSIFEVNYDCRLCNKPQKYVWDLNNLNTRFLDATREEYPFKVVLGGKNCELEYDVPEMKHDIDDYLERIRGRGIEISGGEEDFISTAAHITKIEGIKQSIQSRIEFFENLPLQESELIRYIFEEGQFGVSFVVQEPCTFCGRNNVVAISVTDEFFRDKLRLPEGVRISEGKLVGHPSDAV